MGCVSLMGFLLSSVMNLQQSDAMIGRMKLEQYSEVFGSIRERNLCFVI